MENPAPSLRHAGFTLDGVAYTHIDMAGTVSYTHLRPALQRGPEAARLSGLPRPAPAGPRYSGLYLSLIHI